jgi:phosphatidate cytidylyltransferase
MALSDKTASLLRRIVSSLVLAPPVLAAVYFGEPWVQLVIAAASIEMGREWSRLCDQGRAAPGGAVLAIGAVVAIVLFWRMGPLPALVAVALTALATFVAAMGRGRPTALWLALGAPVIILPWLAFLWLRFDTGNGAVICFWLLAAVWATDIGAYAVGRLVGGPKLWPQVSPNKTWSGLAGGATAAALVGLVTSWLLDGTYAAGLAITGVIVAFVAQAGDLAESAIKRRFGVKDAGRLIPGHGGVLDRVDGLMAAAPAVAVAVWLTGGAFFPWK